MTTVIVDRKDGKVYSDSRGTNTSISGVFNKKEEYTFSKVTKIFSVHKHIITGCGSLELLEKVVELFRTDKKLGSTFYFRSEYDIDYTEVLVNKRTLGHNYTVNYRLKPKNLPLNWVKVSVEREFLTEEVNVSIRGSGMQLAMGAMEQGATPEEAIKIAAKHDMYTGDTIQCYDF